MYDLGTPIAWPMGPTRPLQWDYSGMCRVVDVMQSGCIVGAYCGGSGRVVDVIYSVGYIGAGS